MANQKIDVGYVAELARLELTDEEKSVFQGQLEDIVKYVEKISSVDVEGIANGYVSLKIQKNGEVKKFGLLNCIAGGFVKIDVPDFAEMLAKYKAAMMSEYNLPQRLKSAHDALQPYEKYLN